MDRGQLERLVRIFAALLPTVAGGCDDRGGLIDEDAFDLRFCDQGTLDLVAGIQPAQPAEYTELRDFWIFDPTGEPPLPNVLDAAGELCGGAADPDACAAAFGALPPESSMTSWSGDGGESHRSIALTRGDEALALATPAAVLEFLAPIDAPQDAALLAVAQHHELVCDGRNDAAAADDGFILFTRSGGGCGEGDDISEHVVHVSRDGAIDVTESEVIERGDPNCAVGRLPAGLCRRSRNAPAGVGRFFADVAELEAASVHAFGQLARELAVHGAPRAMVGAALRSRRDEIRHTRMTGALARRFGGRPLAPRVRPLAPRSLVEVAADNAAEGCVRETFGALVAAVQARRATDPRVRRVMRSIAVDETRHAALSWELATWAHARLRPAERRRVSAQSREAIAKLERELFEEQPDEVHGVAGMPRPDQARALFDALKRALAA